MGRGGVATASRAERGGQPAPAASDQYCPACTQAQLSAEQHRAAPLRLEWCGVPIAVLACLPAPQQPCLAVFFNWMQGSHRAGDRDRAARRPCGGGWALHVQVGSAGSDMPLPCPALPCRLVACTHIVRLCFHAALLSGRCPLTPLCFCTSRPLHHSALMRLCSSAGPDSVLLLPLFRRHLPAGRCCLLFLAAEPFCWCIAKFHAGWA